MRTPAAPEPPTPGIVTQPADALERARQDRVPIPPVSRTWPQLDLAAAYRVQQAGLDRRLATGARLVGHKIGLTSEAMQRMLGVHQPDFGYLLDTMDLPDEATVDAGAYLQPRVETEIAFVLGAPLTGPGVTPEDVLAATDHVRVAVELIDSRIADWAITLVDTVADNASSGGFVLGTAQVAVDGLDLAALEGRTHVNGEVVACGPGAAVLGHPARAVAWLADMLGVRGATLEAGQVVLSGACARAVPVGPGDRVTAEVDGLGRATVAFR